MKIALLGATGPSGQEVVAEALERGHEVKALVRNPDKLTTKHENLEVIKVDIFNAEELAEQFKGVEAVLSCLGTRPSYFSLWSVTLYTDAARSIVAAMRKTAVDRFIFMSGWYLDDDPSYPFFVRWMLKPVFIGQILKNMAECESYLQVECPDIDFTSVRAPGLSSLPSSGNEMQAVEGQFVPGYGKTPRRDVAKFMLNCAEKGEYSRKCMAISSMRRERKEQ